MSEIKTAQKNAIEVRDLNFFYGKFQGLRNVTMDIAERKVTAFIGPSGCGKSTLLRTLNRMYSLYPGQRAEGEINFYGQNILDAKQDLNLLRARIGMVFQKPTPFPMTIYDNIAFGLKMHKVPKEEARERVEQIARVLGLTELLARKPRALSGGQRQRVAMGRAIVRSPQVLLMDEPLSNLDAKLRVQMRAEIARIQREVAATTIYVTHDQVEAMTLAHRMLVMNAGKSEQIGAPLEVYNKPATVFVAGFIGSPPMNLIPHERNGKPVLLGIRPEHLEPCAENDAMLLAEIDLVEPLAVPALTNN